MVAIRSQNVCQMEGAAVIFYQQQWPHNAQTGQEVTLMTGSTQSVNRKVCTTAHPVQRRAVSEASRRTQPRRSIPYLLYLSLLDFSF